MTDKNSWSEWWRQFLGFSADRSRQASEILMQRYIEKSQHVARFTHMQNGCSIRNFAKNY